MTLNWIINILMVNKVNLINFHLDYEMLSNDIVFLIN